MDFVDLLSEGDLVELILDSLVEPLRGNIDLRMLHLGFGMFYSILLEAKIMI